MAEHWKAIWREKLHSIIVQKVLQSGSVCGREQGDSVCSSKSSYSGGLEKRKQE